MASYHTTSIDIDRASKKEIRDACKSGDYPVIGGCEYGRLVVRISQNAVVKYGFGVTAAEARTQAYVFEHIDSSIFRVPKVYRFFEDDEGFGTVGYLVMEFVDGTAVNALDSHTQAELSARLAGCLEHLWQISASEKMQPGPIGGGEPRGSIWSDDGASVVFDSISDMEQWLNVSLENDEALAKIGRWDFLDHSESLEPLRDRLSLAGCPMVMCHGDLVGRNAILQENNDLYIIDWGFAGFFPRFFDLYSLISNRSRDPALLDPILEHFTDLKSTHEHELELLRRVQRANTIISRVPKDRQISWSFDDLETPPEPIWPEQKSDITATVP